MTGDQQQRLFRVRALIFIKIKQKANSADSISCCGRNSRGVGAKGSRSAPDCSERGFRIWGGGWDGVGRGIKGWRSTIRTSHLNFSPPKPHACPHSDLYQASFTPSSSTLPTSPPPPPPPALPVPLPFAASTLSSLTLSLLYGFDNRRFNPPRRIGVRLDLLGKRVDLRGSN